MGFQEVLGGFVIVLGGGSRHLEEPISHKVCFHPCYRVYFPPCDITTCGLDDITSAPEVYSGTEHRDIMSCRFLYIYILK